MTSLLYYAGMAADRQTEQIGLAIAADGQTFERFNGSGLVIPRDPAVAWKSLRVCNPTVVRWSDAWVMFYQGVGTGESGVLVHSIAAARSSNATSWSCDPQPLLTFETVNAVMRLAEPPSTGGVIEPAIVATEDGLVMYFVAYVGTYRDGTYLCRATSRDGASWSIDPAWVLSSTQFGDFRLHYPEVVRDGPGFQLWFTLMERRGSSAAIQRMTSADGRHFDCLAQVLPAAAASPAVGPSELISVRVNGRSVRGWSRLNRMIHVTLGDRRPYLGYAHSHLDERAGQRRLYYHAYHLNRRGLVWMDIGCGVVAEGGIDRHRTVLSPSTDSGAWDSYFVADPFVLNL